MIQAYTLNSSGIAYTAGSTIEFENVKFLTNCTQLFNQKIIRIKKPGKYLVQFQGLIGSADAMETVQMYNNGAPVTDAVATTYGSAVADPEATCFSTIVEILPSCCSVDNTANLTFVAETAFTLYKANVVVTRLCQ